MPVRPKGVVWPHHARRAAHAPDPRPVPTGRDRNHRPAVRQLRRAVAVAARADVDDVEYAYWSAVGEGAMNTQCCAECERGHGTLRLLTLSLLRLQELAVQTHFIDAGGISCESALDVIPEATCETSAAAVRLAHRSLEAHADALAYDPSARVGHALTRAKAALAELEPAMLEGDASLAQAHTHRAAVALARAAAATEASPMAVADEIATALAHLRTPFIVIPRRSPRDARCREAPQLTHDWQPTSAVARRARNGKTVGPGQASIGASDDAHRSLRG